MKNKYDIEMEDVSLSADLEMKCVTKEFAYILDKNSGELIYIDVSHEEYEIIRKLEKEAYEGDIDNRFKFNMWIHSTRRDLIGQPLEVIVEEMKKVDYKTLTRGWD